ncbi:hypothetical protein CerSpe_282130 [Prunus speciosa]
MDPCSFVWVTVGNIALKIPVASKLARSVVHPSSSSCFCKIKLNNLPPQNASIPCLPSEAQTLDSAAQANAMASTFHLSKSDLDRVGTRVQVNNLPSSASKSQYAQSQRHHMQHQLGERRRWCSDGCPKWSVGEGVAQYRERKRERDSSNYFIFPIC